MSQSFSIRFHCRAVRGGVWATLLACVALEYQLWIGPYWFPVRITDAEMAGLKGGIALLALMLSCGEAYAHHRSWQLPALWVRRVFFALATAACLLYLYSIQMPGFSYHRPEFFHYYMGSKYQAELGYALLYRCTAIAESELGSSRLAQVRLRRIQDLDIDRRVTTAATLADPERCKVRFSTSRWNSFRDDVEFFREQVDPITWERIQTDHGYNATPLWTTQGRFLAAMMPATDQGLSVLAGIDLVLLSGMFFAVWLTYGWRVLCVALIFWGTVLPGSEQFIGGAMVRQDWLFFTVLSVCLARKRYHFMSGGALAAASLLRVFPVLLFSGEIVLTIVHRLRTGHFKKPHIRIFAGALLVGGALTLVSLAATGLETHTAFIARIRRHRDTPLANNMGLSQVVAFQSSGRAARVLNYSEVDPYSRWSDLQIQSRERRRPIIVGLTVIAVSAFIFAVARQRSTWIARILGLAMIVAATPLTCYYYCVFVVATLPASIHRGFERLALGASGISALLAVLQHAAYSDEQALTQGLLFIGFSNGLLLLPGKGRYRKPHTS